MDWFVLHVLQGEIGYLLKSVKMGMAFLGGFGWELGGPSPQGGPGPPSYTSILAIGGPDLNIRHIIPLDLTHVVSRSVFFVC